MDLSHIDNATNWMENVMLWEKSGQLFMYVLGRVSLLLIQACKQCAMQI